MQTVGRSLRDLGSVKHINHTDVVKQQMNHMQDDLFQLKDKLLQMENFHRFLEKESNWIINLKELTASARDRVGSSYRILGQHLQVNATFFVLIEVVYCSIYHCQRRIRQHH